MESPRAGKQQRNINIEILRIVAMLLIVACHGIIHVDWYAHHMRIALEAVPGWGSAIKFVIVQYGQVGVSLFFIITGYFLCQKAYKKERLIHAYKQVWVYSILLLIASSILYACTKTELLAELFQSHTSLASTVFASIMPFISNSYWFMTAYLFMLALSPFVNAMLSRIDARSVNTLIAILMLMASTVLIFGRNNQWSNVAYALLGYCIGAAFKCYPEIYRTVLTRLNSVILIIVTTALMLMFNYISTMPSKFIEFMGWPSQVHNGIIIGPVVIAAAIFYRFAVQSEPLQITGKTQTVTLAVAKSTFGVYLIHENIFGFRAFWEAVSRVVPTPTHVIAAVPEFIGIVIISFIVLCLVAYCIDRFIMKYL